MRRLTRAFAARIQSMEVDEGIPNLVDQGDKKEPVRVLFLVCNTMSPGTVMIHRRTDPLEIEYKALPSIEQYFRVVFLVCNIWSPSGQGTKIFQYCTCTAG